MSLNKKKGGRWNIRINIWYVVQVSEERAIVRGVMRA